MKHISVKDGTHIFYKDWGTGQPIVFSHGWPLTADAWDAQMLFLGRQGYRVIAHDRRSHGRSTQTWEGNEINCMAPHMGNTPVPEHGWRSFSSVAEAVSRSRRRSDTASQYL